MRSALLIIDMETTLPGAAWKVTPAQATAQRIGGAYWMPPFDHSALRPRAICSFEPAPMLRSKISP